MHRSARYDTNMRDRKGRVCDAACGSVRTRGGVLNRAAIRVTRSSHSVISVRDLSNAAAHTAWPSFPSGSVTISKLRSGVAGALYRDAG